MSTKYGSFSVPRRVEILRSGSAYFNPGQFAYALGWDERGGSHMVDRGHSSKAGGEGVSDIQNEDHEGRRSMVLGDRDKVYQAIEAVGPSRPPTRVIR